MRRKSSGTMIIFIAASGFVVSAVGLVAFFGLLGGGAYQELQNATDAGALAVAQAALKTPFVRVEEVPGDYKQDCVRFFQGYGDAYKLYQYGNDGPDWPTKNKINLGNINRTMFVTQLAYANAESIAYDLLPNTHPVQYPLLNNRPESSPFLPETAKFHYPMLDNAEGPRLRRAQQRLHNALYEKIVHGEELKNEFKNVFFANSLRMWRGLGTGRPQIDVVIKPLWIPGKAFKARRAAFPYSSSFRQSALRSGPGPVDLLGTGSPDYYAEEFDGYQSIGRTGMTAVPFPNTQTHLISARQAAQYRTEPAAVDTFTSVTPLRALPNAFDVAVTLHTQTGNVTVHSYAVVGQPQGDQGQLSFANFAAPQIPWLKQPDGYIGLHNSPGYFQWNNLNFGMSNHPNGIAPPPNPLPNPKSQHGTLRCYRRNMSIVDGRAEVQGIWPNERIPEPPGYMVPGSYIGTAWQNFIQVHQDAQQVARPHASQEGASLVQRRRQMWEKSLQFAPDATPDEIEPRLNELGRLDPDMTWFLQNDGHDHLTTKRTLPADALAPVPQDNEFGIEIYQVLNAPGKHGSLTTDSLVYDGRLTIKLPETGLDTVTCTDAITYGLLTSARHRPNMWITMGSEGTQNY